MHGTRRRRRWRRLPGCPRDTGSLWTTGIVAAAFTSGGGVRADSVQLYDGHDPAVAEALAESKKK
jgi:hypothetical protein